jgi:hypothetical protein
MSNSISFLELRLDAGDLFAVLGSGQCEDVLARAVSQPYVRICMRDPEVVRYRVRCGTVELTDRGLDYSPWDDFQHRGATTRLFAWSTSIMRWMGDNSEAIRELLLERDSVWLEVKDGVFSRIGEYPARQALFTGRQNDEPRVLIQFQVPLAHTDEMLAALRKNSDCELNE